MNEHESSFGDLLKAEEVRTGKKAHELAKALFNLEIRIYHYWKSGQRVPGEWLQQLILHRLKELPRDPKHVSSYKDLARLKKRKG